MKGALAEQDMIKSAPPATTAFPKDYETCVIYCCALLQRGSRVSSAALSACRCIRRNALT